VLALSREVAALTRERDALLGMVLQARGGRAEQDSRASLPNEGGD
jgi:hypothetical protein